MKCPSCGAWTEVLESRSHAIGFTRRRECGNGHKFKTVEVPAPVRRRTGATEPPKGPR